MSLFSTHRRYLIITVLSFLGLIVLSLAIYKYDHYLHTTGKVLAFETLSSKKTPYLVTVEYLDGQQQKYETQLRMSEKPSALIKLDLRYLEEQPQKAALYNPTYLWTLRILRYIATFTFLSSLLLLCKKYET